MFKLALGPIQPSVQWVLGFFAQVYITQDVELVTAVCLVLRLRMRGKNNFTSIVQYRELLIEFNCSC